MQRYPLPNDFVVSCKPIPKFKFKETKKQIQPKTYVNINSNIRTTPLDHFQEVRLITFDYEGEFTPGSVACILPENPTFIIDKVLDLMKWKSDDVFEVDSIPTSMRDILQYAVSPQSVPNRYFFEILREYITNPLQKEKMDEFLSMEGYDQMYDYSIKSKRTCLEVLEDFEFEGIPREFVLDMFPRMKVRKYSISSLYKLEILVAMVEYRTSLKKPRKGVCSEWLKSTQKTQLTVEKGQFIIPDAPICCFATGTGIAPIKSIFEKHKLQNTLFFGVRSQTKDFHFESFFKKLVLQKQLLLKTAFSRDDNVYLQSIMKQNSALILDLYKQGSYFYFCGNSKTIPELLKSLEEILKVDLKKEAHRIQSETW